MPKKVPNMTITYVGVDIGQFRYLKGTPSSYQSSPGVQRYFCATCGSPMAYAGSRWPKEVHLCHGTLEDPAQWPPTGHAHIVEQIDWFEVHDDLPRFEEIAAKGAKPLRKGPRSRPA